MDSCCLPLRSGVSVLGSQALMSHTPLPLSAGSCLSPPFWQPKAAALLPVPTADKAWSDPASLPGPGARSSASRGGGPTPAPLHRTEEPCA